MTILHQAEQDPTPDKLNDHNTSLTTTSSTHQVKMKASFTLAALGASYAFAQSLDSLPQCGVCFTAIPNHAIQPFV